MSTAVSGPDDFDRVGDLLGDFCEVAASPTDGQKAASARGALRKDHVVGAVDLGRAIAVAWPDAVGAEVAVNARPVRERDGRLTVCTSSSIWAHTLQYMGDDLAARLNERLGYEAIQQIVFRHAGWEGAPLPAEGTGEMEETDAATLGLSERQREALEEVSRLDLPSAIREKIVGAMKASFVREQR